MGIMRKLIQHRQKECSSGSSSPSYSRLPAGDNDADGEVRKGYVPVLVGVDQGAPERFLIPTRFISHPAIVSLLEWSADEFGFRQDGVLQIPADPDCFREIIQGLRFRRR